VFRQTKYAMVGETLAIVGGFVDPGEEPLQSAKRELNEELGMVASSWESLGAFRVAANRGGGYTHTFFARNAKANSEIRKDQTGIAQGESERQDIVELSREQLLEALLDGKFEEIKWTATIALALLKTQKH
jgi:ADP-ribose pyrophosphatase